MTISFQYIPKIHGKFIYLYDRWCADFSELYKIQVLGQKCGHELSGGEAQSVLKIGLVELLSEITWREAIPCVYINWMSSTTWFHFSTIRPNYCTKFTKFVVTADNQAVYCKIEHNLRMLSVIPLGLLPRDRGSGQIEVGNFLPTGALRISPSFERI